MSHAKAAPRVHARDFWCLLCDPQCQGEPMKPLCAIEHLKEKHKLTSTMGDKLPQSFLDGGDGYTNTYKWTFPCEVGMASMLEVASGPKVHPGHPDDL
jgi:hypothetical protein